MIEAMRWCFGIDNAACKDQVHLDKVELAVLVTLDPGKVSSFACNRGFC